MLISPTFFKQKYIYLFLQLTRGTSVQFDNLKALIEIIVLEEDLNQHFEDILNQVKF